MRKGLPLYVWRLLEAAKHAAHPPVNATPERLVEYQHQLAAAVINFERQMPVAADGNVVVSDQ